MDRLREGVGRDNWELCRRKECIFFLEEETDYH